MVGENSQIRRVVSLFMHMQRPTPFKFISRFEKEDEQIFLRNGLLLNAEYRFRINNTLH